MAAAGQDDLFGFNEQEDDDTDVELEKECYRSEWSLKELLINEKKPWECTLVGILSMKKVIGEIM